MAATSTKPRVELYDTTLRDGTQGLGVSLSLHDKLRIARLLDEIGFDYIEGGYPLSNPKDVAFFEEARKIKWKHARVCAFGMTRRRGVKPEQDEGMRCLLDAGTPVVTIVGKTWDLHVDEVLNVSRDENLAMITESLAYVNAADHVEQVIYDAEHFFDGYKANPQYALATLSAAVDGGASHLVLCDTNGGSLPREITAAVDAVKAAFGDKVTLGIHVHNDGGLAVANTQAAIDAGCDHAQGTINGIGERCGNVDLVTVAANLALKLNKDVLAEGGVKRLRELSRFVYELANLNLDPKQPYVGDGAFAHKGGMHVHAVQKIAHSYEHVEPQSVGNRRHVLVSELSGASNIAATLGEEFAATHPHFVTDKALQRRVLQRVVDAEHEGYQYEAAQASLKLLAYETMGERPHFYMPDRYRCEIIRRLQDAPITEATVKLRVGDVMTHEVAEGDGPVNALDNALRKALLFHYPALNHVYLTDYKVRVVNPTAATAARVRVTIDFAVRDPEGADKRFTTIGVDENIVHASWQAITDAYAYHLIESQVPTLTTV